jgi:hypothetical protein
MDSRRERTHAYPERPARRDHTFPVGHPGHDDVEGAEPEFSGDIGTTDPIEAVEEGEPYFPPTDPVITTRTRGDEGVEVLGGTTPTSMDELQPEGPAATTAPQPGDEQLREAVLRELREDALTTDLRIDVHVRNGVARLFGTVPTLDDAEAAEEVAARVDLVTEVWDELEVDAEAR